MPPTGLIAVQSLSTEAYGILAALCLIGAVVTLIQFGREHPAASPQRRLLLIVSAVVAAAATLWCAHVFAIAMTNPALGVGYDLRMSGAAFLVALVMAAVGLSLAEGPVRSGDPVMAAIGGAVLGAGVAATHFVGAAAVKVPGRMIVDQTEIVIAGAAAAVACAVAFAIAAKIAGAAGRLSASIAFALALVMFHKLSAGALAASPVGGQVAAGVSGDALLACLAVVGGLSLTFCLGIAAFALSNDRRAERSRDSAFADLTREGIVICAGMRIVDVNVAAARFAGLDPAVMRGRALRDFLDAPDPDRILSASLAKPQEVGLKATGGESAWVEMSSRDVALENRPHRVYTLRDLSEQRRKEHQIRHLAYHDPLTGLANRAAFNEALTAALKKGGEVALFCVDLDKFKEVNDVFGHSAGDEMLRTASRRIVAAAPDAMTFRLGGDEFVVIGTGPDAGDADKLAGRITERLNTETVIAGRTMRCGASVGYAVYPHHGENADTLFANADSALYRAKADGRGLARGFEPEMDLALREKRALQQDLATAVSRGEMFLHWMPQAHTKSGEIVGFEALIRWKHPTRGVVPPMQFIPVAEETAAIVPIGEWVLRTACSMAVRWARPGKVAVNLSPVQFQHGDIVELVHSILLETGLSASRLELEITEGVLLEDLNGALNTLRRLKALGVQIAMDDFGTGYSSLSYLQAFPFDRIKIDASFIRTLSTSPQAKAIVRAVVALGASLDMPITAEGVETAEQREFLAELNCEEIQGYLVGRPSPVVSFETPFSRHRMLAAG